MDFLQKLGQNLKRIREAAKITQAKLAELADVSVSTIARLEGGESFSTYNTVERIAKALNIDIEALFDMSFLEQQNNTHEEFIEQINKHAKLLKTSKDYEFILNVIKEYVKTR